MKKDDYYDLKIILWLLLFLVFGLIIITCKSGRGEYIMTVNGPESTGKMGITLEHEHILVDFIGADCTNYSRWNRDTVISKVLPLLLKAKEKGLNTFIDCTPAYLGRDPKLLERLSRLSGINIITNTGYYGARNNFFIPKSFYTLNDSELAQQWIAEFENGIEGTDIKPGFIKIGVNPDDSLSSEHRKIISAAALAHLRTGLVIASHTGPDNPAFAQIRILKAKGVSPSAFIWVHAQIGTMEGNVKAAKEGAWISLDNIHQDLMSGSAAQFSISWYADRLLALKKQGLLNKVLISHDSGWYDPAKPGGGTINGYTNIFNYLIPALKLRGFTAQEIDMLLKKNPLEAFKIKIHR